MDQIEILDVEDNSHDPLRSTNAGDAENQPNNSQKPPPSKSMNACATILLILLLPIIIPFLIYICFKGPSKDNPKDGYYAKINCYVESAMEKLQRVIKVVADKLGYVALLWFIFNLRDPSLKRLTLFGSPLWKWSLFAVVILLGHLCSRILTRRIVGPAIRFLDTRGREEIQLFTEGLQSSFSTFVYFGLVLTVWRVYFHGDDGLNPSPRVDKYGTWSLAIV